MKWRFGLLLGAVAALTIVVFLFPAIPQSEAYHHFADTRAFGDVPNALDVLSNAFFLIVGAVGMRFVLRGARSGNAPGFLDPRERWPYLILFLGVALTTFGSAYYHAHPEDARLVWDRLPMTLGFMSLLAATLNERINVEVGSLALAPLLIFGFGSVVYWSVTQSHGRGDLRPYALAQFGSLAMLLLLLALFPPRYTRGADLIVSLGIYALAKGFEAADRPIFKMRGIISGHTLKHIAAAVSAYWILRMLKLRAPVARGEVFNKATP